MANYTFRVYGDMILHGEARRNERAVRQLYAQRFPYSQTPSHSLFAKVYKRSSETDTFTASRSDCSAPRRRCTPELEEAVYEAVEEDATSTQRVVGRLNVDHKTI